MNNRARSLAATSLAHFVNDGGQYVFITLYPTLFPSSTQFAYVYIGALAAVQSLFSVAASPFVGRSADASGKYDFLLFIGLSLLGLGILGFAISVLFTRGFYLFLFLIPFSAIAGVGSAFYHPLGATVLTETWDLTSLGRAMGINGSLGSVGRAIFPLIVAILVVYFTIPSVLTLTILYVGIAFAVYRMLRTVHFGRIRTAGTAIKKGGEQEGRLRKPSITINRLIPLILPLTIVSFMKGFFSFGVVNFVAVYVEHIIGINFSVELGLVLTLVLAMPIVGQPIFGYVADMFGRRLALGISIGGSGLAILVLLATSNLYLQIACLALFGFFVFTGFPLLMPLASGAVPPEAATLSNSIVWGLGNAGGGAVGPLLIGILAQPGYFGSLGNAFLLATIVSLLSIVLLPFVRTSRR